MQGNNDNEIADANILFFTIQCDWEYLNDTM